MVSLLAIVGHGCSSHKIFKFSAKYIDSLSGRIVGVLGLLRFFNSSRSLNMKANKLPTSFHTIQALAETLLTNDEARFGLLASNELSCL